MTQPSEQPTRWRCWRVLGPEDGHCVGSRIGHDVFVVALTLEDARVRAAVLLGCQAWDVRGVAEQ